VPRHTCFAEIVGSFVTLGKKFFAAICGRSRHVQDAARRVVPGRLWRMAGTAIRLAILAACADTFYVLIDGRHFKPPLP